MEVNIPYGPLYTGEQSISSVKDNAVVIIGITREGKTCVYNKIANKTMVGKVVEDTICYVPHVQTSTNISYGQMSNSLGSVTFEPNITHLSSVTSLIDLAGQG